MPASRDSRERSVQACMDSLRRIVKALENYATSVEKRFGLTGPQLWALWELGQGGAMALKDLAARMKLDSSTVVGVVDRLVVKGLVIRNPDPSDRRKISLTPTDKGCHILAQAPHPAQGHLLKGLESMEPRKMKALQRALHSLEIVLGADGLKAPFFLAEG